MFKFDRSAYNSFKASDHINDLDHWLKRTPEERLKAAYYLNAIAFGFDPENEPRVDKTVFSARKRT